MIKRARKCGAFVLTGKNICKDTHFHPLSQTLKDKKI